MRISCVQVRLKSASYQPRGDPILVHVRLHGIDFYFLSVEHASRKSRSSARVLEHLRKVLWAACAAAGDDGYAHSVCHCPRQLNVEALLRAQLVSTLSHRHDATWRV